MKAVKVAVIVGAVSAAVTWMTVYFIIHEFASGRTANTLVYVTDGSEDDDDLTASLWAAGAYLLTFTPTLLCLQGRARKDAFTQRQSGG